MTFGSLFSEIGGIDLGFERAGMDCRWQVEINPFRRKVLATHWPEVSRYEDIKECGSHNLKPVDCITAGVPCQDWSVAGRRAGISGSRSGLFFEFARILQELRPAWFVFENVPGIFSQNQGRDFATVLSVLMEECGYGVSWRVCDSQFFGVAQRRRRVYIVGYLGAPCPPEILFEPKGGSGNTEESEKAGKEVSHALTGSSVSSGYRFDPNGEDYVVVATLTPGSGRVGSRGADDGSNIVYGTLKSHRTGGWTPEPGEHLVAATLTSRSSPKGHGAAGPRVEDIPNFIIQDVRGGTRDETTFIHPRQLRNSESSNQVGIKPGAKVSDALTSEGPGAVGIPIQSKQPAVHEPIQKVSQPESRHGASRDVAFSLRKDPGGTGQGHKTNYVSEKTYPDRGGNTPGLSEGLDDPWPLLPKGLDSPRYQALGDAVTVQVAEWIGRRIVRFLESGHCS